MHRILCIAGIIGALATIMVAFDANAFSISPVPNQSSNVTLVAGGCGLGFHRGPYGGCRPNIAGYPTVGYGGGVVLRLRLDPIARERIRRFRHNYQHITLYRSRRP